jgi:eukaryotic-like serine/threonine-protein kinase
MESCVETDELVAMLDGNLPSDRVEAVLVHVDRCASCAEVIANLARESGLRGVGRYQLGRVIGSGGMGVVHEGWDPELRRRVAVKLVRPERSDDAAHARMLREARALARISHPNVVAVYDVGEHGGEIYVATELVDGETMATWCEGRSARAIVEAWIQAGRGLDAAHAGGIVHRDVKPANVLVGRDGRVRIGDFGLARLGPRDAQPPPQLATPPRGVPVSASRSFPTVTDAGSIGGTPAYMAPEQWLGVNDARSDQYALAVAVVESLTGKRPGDGAFALPEGTAGGEALASALARALRAEPEARYPSVGAFADALAGAIVPPARRSRIAVAAAAIAVTAVGVGAAIAWRVARPGPACEPRAIPADVWSPARRAALAWRFPRAIGEHLDVWMAGWSAAAADTCAVDGDAPVLRARRERCLDESLDQARKLLARWGADPAHPSISAQIGIELLPRPARCSHAVAAAQVEPTQAQAFAITQLRARMDLALYVVKRDAVATLREVAAAARVVGHVPFIAETAVELAKQIARADRAAAAAGLREVLALVDRARDDFARARVAAALIATLDSDGVDEALAVAEPARAGLARLGGDPALEHDLDVALGAVLKGATRPEEALAAFERARATARDAYGPDSMHEANTVITLEGLYSQRDPAAPGAKQLREVAVEIYRKLGVPVPPGDSSKRIGTPAAMIAMLEPMVAQKHELAPNTLDEATAIWALGNAYFLGGRLDRALEQYRRAAEMYDRLKIRTSAAVDAHAHIAQVLLDTGQLPEAQGEAQREADRAVVLANAIGVKQDLAYALTVQGQVRLALGDLPGAREVLKHALQIRIDLNAPPTQIANTQFHYAQALWEIDRREAVELATSARVLLRSYVESEVPEIEQTHVLPVQKQRLDDINRWLDEHRR